MKNEIDEVNITNDQDEVNITNDQDEVNPQEEVEMGLPADPPEVEPQDEEVEDTEELKRRNQELYEQLKKAKGFKRDPKTGKWVKPEAKPEPEKVDKTSSDITIMELKSLLAANIQDDDDTEEVRLWARAHKVSITDALKNPVVKSMLKTRVELRKSADIANVSPSRRQQAAKPQHNEVLEKASQGEFPEDPAELARARTAKQLEQLKERTGR